MGKTSRVSGIGKPRAFKGKKGNIDISGGRIDENSITFSKLRRHLSILQDEEKKRQNFDAGEQIEREIFEKELKEQSFHTDDGSKFHGRPTPALKKFHRFLFIAAVHSHARNCISRKDWIPRSSCPGVTWGAGRGLSWLAK
jgi:hypothetical protein